MTAIFSQEFKDRAASPVVFHKGGLCAIHQSEGVFGGVVPINGINAVGAVVVAGDDDAANELFGAFILEVLFALSVQCVPGRQSKRPKGHGFSIFGVNGPFYK